MSGIGVTTVPSSEGEGRPTVPLAKKRKEVHKLLIPLGDVIEISSDDEEPLAAVVMPPTQDLRRQIKKLKEVRCSLVP
jgi:hypothetical protein